MKAKEEILRMSKKEIMDYKWSEDLSEGSDCSGCSGCSDCSRCSDCYGCRNAKGLKFAICNVEMTEDEYRIKIKELNT